MEDLIFTQHAKNRLADTNDDGRSVLTHLRKVVRKQLKKLGQWNHSPKYLGCEGSSWSDSDTLDELVAHVYLYCFADGLPGLRMLLNGSDDVEGAVVQKIRWCLLDRKRRANPRGSRLFFNVRSTSETLIEHKHAQDISPPICGTSIILAIGQKQPNERKELPGIFVYEVGSSDFLKSVSQRSNVARELLFKTLVEKLYGELRGFQIADLVDLLADALADPSVISGDDLIGGDSQSGAFSELFEDLRTESGEDRYLTNEAFQECYQALRKHAQSSIRKERIRDRVLRVLDYIAEQIEMGERIENLEQAKIARHFGIATSTLGEDIARLKTVTLTRPQDALERNSEGGNKK